MKETLLQNGRFHFGFAILLLADILYSICPFFAEDIIQETYIIA
ncbi:hypothetical protein ACFWDG_27415 [Peribacillus sp. NPDC060186]